MVEENNLAVVEEETFVMVMVVVTILFLVKVEDMVHFKSVLIVV